ncbi:MAG: hypothetical protein SGPRY_005107 [Prymnesium sp.]
MKTPPSSPHPNEEELVDLDTWLAVVVREWERDRARSDKELCALFEQARRSSLYFEWLEECEALHEETQTDPRAFTTSSAATGAFRQLIWRHGLTANRVGRFNCPVEDPPEALAALLEEFGWGGSGSALDMSALRDALLKEPTTHAIPESVAQFLAPLGGRPVQPCISGWAKP